MLVEFVKDYPSGVVGEVVEVPGQQAHHLLQAGIIKPAMSGATVGKPKQPAAKGPPKKVAAKTAPKTAVEPDTDKT